MKYEILIGKNRSSTVWDKENIEIKSFFDKYYVKPSRIKVTTAEWAKKEIRDELKDVGGFVGATSLDRSRHKNSITARTLICLDADYADSNFITKAQQVLKGASYIMHTTASHIPINPRYRLIITPNRYICPEEYAPVCRAIMAQIGIEYFDTTCCDINRLMFFPAVPEGADYYSELFEGAELDIDALLKTQYNNWKDQSEWYYKENENPKNHTGKKQADPETKKGIIGAFCRIYSIYEAIETFLSDIYCEGTKEDRYTLEGGSTINGLWIIDGIFAYSFHDSDPASGQLCNAFDLVRLHKGFEIKEMVAWASDIPEVRSENLASEFEERQQEEKKKEQSENITGKLRVNNRGIPTNSFYNYCLLAKHYLKDSVKLNEFTGEIDVVSKLPWRGVESVTDDMFNLKDVLNLRFVIDKEWEMDSKEKLQDGFLYVANESSYHPIKNYLEYLEWDGKERMDTLFIDFLNAENSDYVRTITHALLIGLIKRIYEPGCKFDLAPVLQGSQGCRKSLLLNRLGKHWSSDALNKEAVDNIKETAEQLKGCWLMEIAEMAATSKKDVESVKNLITRVSDKCRLAYAQTATKNPRTTVFVCTTNDDTPFRDWTGNRRFPLIKVSKSEMEDDEWSEKLNIDQVWAEAFHKYKNGDREIRLSADIFMKIEEEANEAIEIDPWFDAIQQYVDNGMIENYWDIEDIEFDNKPKIEWDMLYTDDVWVNCLQNKRSALKTTERKRLVHTLKQLGFTEKVRTRTKKYGKIVCYKKP